jgi:hypothetical protein
MRKKWRGPKREKGRKKWAETSCARFFGAEPLRVSLAARQWRKDIPAEWLEQEPELCDYDDEAAGLGRARAYYRVESGSLAGVFVEASASKVKMHGEECDVFALARSLAFSGLRVLLATLAICASQGASWGSVASGAAQVAPAMISTTAKTRRVLPRATI